MKVKDLIQKCGLASTNFTFTESNSVVGGGTSKDITEGHSLWNRNILTYRVGNGSMRVFLKY